MSNVLFLSVPAHGHVNPTLGLVHELTKRGERVTYFCAEEFREKIERSGAEFISFTNLPDSAKGNSPRPEGNQANMLFDRIDSILKQSDSMISDVLDQIKGRTFDYVVYSSMYPLGNIIAQVLKLPSIASFAVFATLKELMEKEDSINPDDILNHPVQATFKQARENIKRQYNAELPEDIMDLFFMKGDLNIAYTSEYFVSHAEYYDDSFIFIGPPIYDRKENLEFPFERLKGRKVIYISLGTVFNTDLKLYEIFFKSFGDTDAVVVLSAYKVDLSSLAIPDNFIVRSFIPQSEILQYTNVAITHAGMNSTSDLLYAQVPFVAIPISADQPYMAGRAAELGAAIALDKDTVTPELLKDAVDKVTSDPSYADNLKKISDSFKAAGGYPKAADAIFKLVEKQYQK
ncbi:glycosyl transferase [Paenibacillus sp. HN-1]|uniref:macrolide family glycosyltransferase n=1 Tax=Paenibacillus TaxID=44249 RepID=UPI001CA873F3|nr:MULTISPECIES: macrolide family glycosyltransferase [Paenibacillus]MBY9078409.1 glycosyl transferase [Paenibacillus sp. CGMCC 1.18879]MBY9087876.1 glycosyl transferase [Paenibacillus sinensis]